MDYIEKMREINDAWAEKHGRRKRAGIRTYGCQMNEHDSEKLAGMLENMGYCLTDREEDADLLVYNTCCIRESAENKVYGRLGLLKYMKESNKELLVALCGCMTQQKASLDRITKNHGHVDVIFGTYNMHRFPELLYTRVQSGGQVIDIWEEHGGIHGELPSKRRSPFKAGVNIMYGCDNYCAYCVVPYVRGRERSRLPEDVAAEVERLAEGGVKEVMLLGQNVNSYGRGLEPGVTFAKLLRRVNDVEGIRRIRFMTSHPKDLSDELILAMKECENVCGHLHLPVQSGSDAVLRRMNRRYTGEHYLKLIDKLRAAMPDIAVTTDIIVGFPGETDADFEDTLNIVRSARFSGAFTFLYSKRTGTPAADMPGQIDEKTAKERFERLLAIINPLLFEDNQRYLGKTLPVLVEEEKDGILTARTDGNRLVHFSGGNGLVGEITPVEITCCKTFYLEGRHGKVNADDGAIL